MSANYKKLGEIVELIDERNKALESSEVLGISIDKEFMPSVANTIGTDLSNYKLLRMNTFACNPMHVGRDERLPVSLYKKDIPAIVSPAYFMFRVKDENKVLPDFLMLIFKRNDFDRNCWFRTDGSVRGGITWNDICEIELPVPDLKEQEKIVNTYNAITKRIQLKQKINENLEKTAQIVYKKMFVEDADKQWKIGKLSDYCNFQEGYVNPPQEYPEYFDGMIKWLRAVDINESYVLNTSRTLTELGFKSAGASALLFKPNTIAITKSGTIGRLAIISDFMCGNRAIINIEPNEKLYLPFIHQYLKSRQKEFLDMSVGSVQKNLYVSILAELPIIKPELSIIEEYYKTVECLYEQKLYNCKEIDKLQELSRLVISRISGM